MMNTAKKDTGTKVTKEGKGLMTLKKWKLTPKQLDHPSWEASDTKSPIIVEAESADEARQVASEKYPLITSRDIRQTKRTSPWLDHALADCTELTE